jgi:hypothetical protein
MNRAITQTAKTTCLGTECVVSLKPLVADEFRKASGSNERLGRGPVQRRRCCLNISCDVSPYVIGRYAPLRRLFAYDRSYEVVERT